MRDEVRISRNDRSEWAKFIRVRQKMSVSEWAKDRMDQLPCIPWSIYLLPNFVAGLAYSSI